MGWRTSTHPSSIYSSSRARMRRLLWEGGIKRAKDPLVFLDTCACIATKYLFFWVFYDPIVRLQYLITFTRDLS